MRSPDPERYTTFTQEVPRDDAPADGTPPRIDLYDPVADERLVIQPNTHDHALVYRGLLQAVRSVPATRHELLDRFAVSEPDVRTFAEAALDGLIAAKLVVATSGLASSHQHLPDAGTVRLLEKISTGMAEVIVDSGTYPLNARRDDIPCKFSGAWVAYRSSGANGNGAVRHAFGTGATAEEAALKARAEAVERLASRNVRVDLAGVPASGLRSAWIDPRIAAPLCQEQMTERKVLPFDVGVPINWTVGYDLTSGDTVYAPSSLVYHPYRDAADRYASLVSSGVAAHFDPHEAIQSGLMELIERDAVMRTWILREIPSRVSPDSLPSDLAEEICAVSMTGRQVDVLDITQSNGVPAYLVTVRSETFPHFVAGSAAGLEPENAVRKALHEAVFSAATRSRDVQAQRDEHAAKSASGVFDVFSHAMYYADDLAAVETLSWLNAGQQRGLARPADSPTFTSLKEQLNPTVFELDNPVAGNELRIVRIVAPDLLPIMFGTSGVPYTHRSLPKGTRAPGLPHFLH